MHTLITRKFLFILGSICLLSAAILSCGKKDDTPKPELVPIYSMFRLFKVNNTDTAVAGWGYLDQTVTNNVRITIKLDEAYRTATGQYNISLYQITGNENGTFASNVGIMPANSLSWQSEDIKQGSSTPYKFDELHKKNAYFIKILQNNNEIARGQLELAW